MHNAGETVELAIHDIGIGGEGIGSLDRFKVFVPLALPLEKVKAKLSKVKKNYALAVLEKIDQPSPHRVEPICPVFGLCGGCQIMHLGYEQQLLFKQQRVNDAFVRIGHLAIEVAPCEPSPAPLAYRNKIQLPYRLDSKGNSCLGLYAADSHDIVPIERCYIHCDLGEKIFQKIKELLLEKKIAPYDGRSGQGDLRHLLIKSAIFQKQVMIVFVGAKPACSLFKSLAEELFSFFPEVVSVMHNYNPEMGNNVLGKKFTCLKGGSFIEEMVCEYTFRISAPSFFQVNTAQAEQLYRKAIELACLQKEDRVIDLYCGVGMLSLFTAPSVSTVIGIEYVLHAIEDARFNAKKAGVDNCQFICGKAEVELLKVKKADVVFVNPPRKGCEQEVLAALIELKPRVIIYISCDPATLARDLTLLTKNGFSCTKAYPFDMFPQTTHVETIVRCTAD